MKLQGYISKVVDLTAFTVEQQSVNVRFSAPKFVNPTSSSVKNIECKCKFISYVYCMHIFCYGFKHVSLILIVVKWELRRGASWENMFNDFESQELELFGEFKADEIEEKLDSREDKTEFFAVGVYYKRGDTDEVILLEFVTINN